MWRTTSMAPQNPARSGLPERTTLVAFLLYVIVAGGSAIAVRTTYGELSPFWAASSRFLVASAAVWAFVRFRHIPLPRGRALLGAVLFGTLTGGLAFALITWGLEAMPASRYQILMATVPLLTVLFSFLHGVEAISPRRILGSFLAVGGIALTLGRASSSQLSLECTAAILLGAACMAEGGVVIKMFPPIPPIMTNAIGLTVGGLVLAVASLISGEKWTIPARTSTWIALVYLVVFASVLGFLMYIRVLSKWSASGASYAFVLSPLVTMVAASTLAGENITWGFLVGAGMVLAGVFVGVLLPSRKKPAVESGCTDSHGQVLPDCT
jgi:drug/metabolite transporter (DMT)-like permease